MNEIKEIKEELRHKQWSEMIQSRCSSGKTVKNWCAEKGINIKTYYYRLKCLRKAAVKEIENHDIVSLDSVPEECQKATERIEIISDKLRISIPDNFNPETLKRIVEIMA